MVQLVIMRAQRPVRLTAGKLYSVSMETFAKARTKETRTLLSTSGECGCGNQLERM
jgi:hypothetical protein